MTGQKLTPIDAYRKATKLNNEQTFTLVNNINVRNINMQLKLLFKLKALYANILPIRYDDPEPVDLALLALQELGHGRVRVSDVVINTLGLELSQFTTSDPCSSTYISYIENREIEQFIVRKARKRRKRYKMKYGGYEEYIMWGILVDNKNTVYLAKLVYDHSYDIRNTSTYVSLTLLPIVEKIELKVVREGTRVICGPDGYANKYKRSFTYVFPPA